jgi:DNA-binding XRE family transcriptional regulator
MKLDDLITLEQLLEEELQDPEFRAEWERLAPARAVALSLVGYRIDHGLTQTALGRLLGISQPAIARLEAGDHLPTLATLLKLTEVLGLDIQIAMTPAKRSGDGACHEPNHTNVSKHLTTVGGVLLTIAIR